MRPDHALASRSFIVAEDFVAEHLITYNAPKEDLTIFQEVLVPAGVIPRQHSQVELTEGVLERAKAGLRISRDGEMGRCAISGFRRFKGCAAYPGRISEDLVCRDAPGQIRARLHG